MTYGRKPTLQDGLAECTSTPQTFYGKLIKEQLDKCREDAIITQSVTQEQAARFYNTRHRPKAYEVGELVLIKKAGRQPKLSPKYEGPLEVLDRHNDIYKLRHCETNRTYTRHVCGLKPYSTNNDAANSNEEEISNLRASDDR